MKPQSVDNFMLFNIFGSKNKISKLLSSVGISCKQRKGVLNWENGQNCRAVIKYFCKKGMSQKEIHGDFVKILWEEFLQHGEEMGCWI